MYSAVPEGDDGADMADLKASLGDAVVKIGMGAAMKNKWLRKEGTVLKRALAGVVDEVQAQLREIQLSGGAEGVLLDGFPRTAPQAREEIEQAILQTLQTAPIANSMEAAEAMKVDHEL